MKSEIAQVEQRLQQYRDRPLSSQDKQMYEYVKRELERRNSEYDPFLKINVLLRVSS
jgi:hypothetical protein